MSFFKKTAAAFLVSGIALQTSAFAAIDFGTDTYDGYVQEAPYVAPKELRKLVNLEFKVVSVLDRSAKSAISAIKDQKTRKFYADVNASKKSDLKSLFSELRSGMKYEFMTPETENAKDMLRFAVKGYLEFIKEARSAASGTSVSASEKASVEAELVNFQRDLLVEPMREVIDTYAKSDVKETGDWKGSVKTPFGNVNAKIDRYSSILSILGLSQEADFVFSADFDLELPGPTKYDPETYERIESPSIRTKGTVKFDANVKMIDSDAYVLLRDYSIDVSVSGSGSEDAAKEMDEQIAKAKASLSLLKGKTVKIAVPKDGSAPRPDVILKKAGEVLSVLDSDSVFTPVRKVGENRYGLGLKPETLVRIAKIFEQKVTKWDMRRAENELAAAGLAFESVGGTASVSTTDPKGSGNVRMTRSAAGYAFKLNNVDARSRTVLEVSKTSVKFVSKSKYSDVVATWENGATELIVTTSGTEAFKASGTLTMKKVDLAFAVAGKKVGTAKYQKTGNSYSSDLFFEFELPPGMMDKSGNVAIESSQKGTVESGTFEIETPKDVVDIEALLK